VARHGPPERPDTVSAVSVSARIAPLLDAPRTVSRGSVLSVHASVVNLLVDGRLLTVASEVVGNVPNGLLIAGRFDPGAIGLRPGMTVMVADGRLAIGGRLVIDCKSAPRWQPELVPVTVLPDLPARAALAGNGACPPGLSGIVAGAHAFAALVQASVGGSAVAIVAAGRPLVGLGAGLTPAGDDVLVGFTAGLTAIGDDRARDFATAWAQHAVGRTTLVAEAFHRHAAAGAYSERLHDVLRAILHGPPAAIPAATRAASAWGATSGADTLAGILVALRPAAVLGAAALDAA
jgi:Protein of unknown function (DUF2877)